ncbi:MAG: WGR domain-containing protein [Pseudomonadota bacterium]|nr:WGR domain-containing protein [Pseudomonadota bacterium]
MRRWIQADKARYYQAHLVKDLFGEWILVCSWGGLGTARGGYSSTGVASHEEGLRRLEALHSLRRQHGYLPVDSLADRPTPAKPAKRSISPAVRRRNDSAQQELDLGT